MYPTSTVHLLKLFVAVFLQRTGRQSVQWQFSDLTCELRNEHQAEANIVVTVVRIVVVTIRRTTILSIVVPATAAQNAVRTSD